jgi:hypothetical protein
MGLQANTNPKKNKNCGPQAKTTKLLDVPIQEMDTQTNHSRKMIFSGIHDRWHIQFESLELTHPSTKIIEPLQPRLETSMSREPRSHLIESRLESYSKPNGVGVTIRVQLGLLEESGQ